MVFFLCENFWEIIGLAIQSPNYQERYFVKSSWITPRPFINILHIFELSSDFDLTGYGLPFSLEGIIVWSVEFSLAFKN